MYIFRFLLLWPLACVAGQLPLDEIRLPPGFRIEVYAKPVPGARSMALAPSGILYVGSRSEGRVYAILPSRKVTVLLSGLDTPNGVAFRNGALYVAEVDRILRFDSIESALENPPAPIVIYDRFPKDAHHGWKFIRFGPDGWLYVPVGAPCNSCEADPARYAAIFRLKPDGSLLERYASGVRNSVGFDWDPGSGELWFTDNGRDWLGNDAPPDELNHAAAPGMNFGYPYCHGKSIADPEYGKKHRCGEFTPPALELPAHVAALGMRFYTGKQFPEQYRNRIFIAEHGSWNRFPPTGYRISCVSLSPAIGYQVFASGWLDKFASWGRPVDLEVMPDGSLLVSDDKAGAIYRISYQRPHRP